MVRKDKAPRPGAIMSTGLSVLVSSGISEGHQVLATELRAIDLMAKSHKLGI